jgi:hypothetical protein
VEALSPAEILTEALKLSLPAQEEIANRLTYCILGELQALGYEDQAKSGRPAR